MEFLEQETILLRSFFFYIFLVYFSYQNKRFEKDLSSLQGDMGEKLDRSELQPLREYLGKISKRSTG